MQNDKTKFQTRINTIDENGDEEEIKSGGSEAANTQETYIKNNLGKIKEQTKTVI